jgi:hypothetical protein
LRIPLIYATKGSKSETRGKTKYAELVFEDVMRRWWIRDANVHLDHLALERFLRDFGGVEVELPVPFAQFIDWAVALA